MYINKQDKIGLHRPGIEPGPPAWQASILPLNQRCWVGVFSALHFYILAVVAEWLRRLTRNQFPSGSVGSNPTNCVTYFQATQHYSLTNKTRKMCVRSCPFLDSLVVRISACHVEGPGSIPGRGETFSSFVQLDPFTQRKESGPSWKQPG
jgi:hypothetical protein